MLIFHSNKKINFIYPDIKLNDFPLEPVHSVTYLGIEIDDILSWNTHIELLCKKLSRSNAILSKLRHYVPQKTLVSIYYSIFHSYATYDSLAWSSTTTKKHRKNKQTTKKMYSYEIF